MIYIFYKNDNSNERIIISADTYLEAANAIIDLYGKYSNYNLKEYKTEHIYPTNDLNIDPLYRGLPYILTENQYEKIKSKINENNISSIVKKEFDHSNEKYNSAIPYRNVETDCFEDCVNRINEKNGINKKELDKIYNERDCELLNNIKNNLYNILSNYVNLINNQQMRNNIKNDLTDLIKKYEDNNLFKVNDIYKLQVIGKNIKLISKT